MFFNNLILKDSEIYLYLIKTNEANFEKNWAPSYNFNVCLLDGTKIGYLNFRVDNSKITKYCGNVGYSIDEKYRGNHYSAKAVKLILQFAKSHGLKYILITCETTNIASNKICEFLDAKYVETLQVPETHEMYLDGNRILNVYKIDIV
ncbi:MAG: GNAT family N-acetyltransferase [Alphaproteobacteria bacterium]|nr:GNAT family N-acetyltransferase [Alphaproteobacteria bacterium]